MTASVCGYSGGYTVPVSQNSGAVVSIYPMFSANISAHANLIGATIPFSNVVMSSPIISLNTTNYTFTCNITGIYELCYVCQFVGQAGNNYWQFVPVSSPSGTVPTCQGLYVATGIAGQAPGSTGATTGFSQICTLVTPIIYGTTFNLQIGSVNNNPIVNDANASFVTMVLLQGGLS